jgi:hypothetical protein
MSKARVVKRTKHSKTATKPKPARRPAKPTKPAKRAPARATAKKAAPAKRTLAARKKPAAKRKPAAPRKPAPKRPRTATKPTAKTTKRAATKPAVKTNKPIARKKPTAPPGPVLDLFKLHRDQYATPSTPVIIETQPAQYLAIAGQGMPGGEAFVQQMGALYSIAYTIKMARKFSGGGDYKVGMLEALWWHDHPGLDFDRIPADQLRRELLIRTPDFITVQDLTAAVERLEDKDKTDVLRGVRLVTLAEGTCVQLLHVGPYSREGDSVARMVDFARAQGHTVHGRHHEMYMSDPRRMAPEKLRTILRLPVRKPGAQA